MVYWIFDERSQTHGFCGAGERVGPLSKQGSMISKRDKVLFFQFGERGQDMQTGECFV